jgi:hypothetical protein
MSSTNVVGFSAIASIKTFKDKPVASYNNVHCNLGGHFNQKTGIFKAPFDGTYVACITLLCYVANEGLRVTVQHDDDEYTSFCTVFSRHNEVRCCDIGIVEIKKGHTLHAEIFHDSNILSYSAIRFSCFKIG